MSKKKSTVKSSALKKSTQDSAIASAPGISTDSAQPKAAKKSAANKSQNLTVEANPLAEIAPAKSVTEPTIAKPVAEAVANKTGIEPAAAKSITEPTSKKQLATSVKAYNPATGEEIGEVQYTQLEEIPAIFERARSAQKIWGAFSFEQRQTYMFKMRDYMLDNADELARIISANNGKTIFDAFNTEIIPGIMALDWYGKKAGHHLRRRYILPSSLLFANKQNYVMRLPLGVVGVISPWNYPFSIPFGEIIMGLMAGNAVMYKTAKETPLVGKLIERILHAGNLPHGLTHFFMGDGATISNAFLDNNVNKIFFTGSVRVGRGLMMDAAKKLIPVSLELGGNDAMIILEDANLERAANGAIWGGFQNSGQSCGGVERIYVQETVAEEFYAILKKKIESMRHGIDRGDFKIDIGSMTVERQLNVVKEHVADALAKGATLLAQSTLLDPVEGKNFYPATVLTNCNHTMDTMRYETFGPVVGCMTFKTDEEALALANDSDLGLTGSVWTLNRERGMRLAERMECGVSNLNDHLYTHGASELPWNGWKNSGIGVTHAHIGLEEMTKVKMINVELMPNLNSNLWWYPASKSVYDALLWTMKILFGRNLWVKLRAVIALKPMILTDPLLKEKIRYIFARVFAEWKTRLLFSKKEK